MIKGVSFASLQLGRVTVSGTGAPAVPPVEDPTKVYGSIDVTLSYSASNIPNTGGQYVPSISVRRNYTIGEVSGYDSYTSISAIKNAGGSVSFALVSGASNTFSVSSTDGLITVSANSDTSEKTASVKLTVTFEGKSGNATSNILTQDAAEPAVDPDQPGTDPEEPTEREFVWSLDQFTLKTCTGTSVVATFPTNAYSANTTGNGTSPNGEIRKISKIACYPLANGTVSFQVFDKNGTYIGSAFSVVVSKDDIVAGDPLGITDSSDSYAVYDISPEISIDADQYLGVLFDKNQKNIGYSIASGFGKRSNGSSIAVNGLRMGFRYGGYTS